MYFLTKIWCFKICFSERRSPRRFFSQDPNSQSILHLLSYLTPSIPAFSKIWMLVKSSCFAITHFSLHSSQRSKFLKHFLVLWVLKLVIFSIAFSIIQWFLQSSFDISKVNIPSFDNFFCFSAVVRSFPLSMFKYILWTKRKNSFY